MALELMKYVWYSLKYLNADWLATPTACRRICIFYKTGNPKNDDLSDKSGSYGVMHKSFNKMFDIIVERLVAILFKLS